MANEYNLINPNSKDERQKRVNQIFEFIINKQFYCAVAYAKVCKLREDEYNKVYNIKDDSFNKLYTLLAYAFDDPWYGAKAYDNFDLKPKKIEDKDYSSFDKIKDEKDFVDFLFLSIAIRILYSKESGYSKLHGKFLSNDQYKKLKSIFNPVIEDLEKFKEETGKVLAVCADKKQYFKDIKSNITIIDKKKNELEDLRKQYSRCNTKLENEIREDIFEDNSSLVYEFYEDAIKKQNTEILWEGKYKEQFLDDELCVDFGEFVDKISGPIYKKSKNSKDSKDSDEYDKISVDLDEFLNAIVNFLYDCEKNSSNINNADRKYIDECGDVYLNHLKELIEAIKKIKNEEKSDKSEGYIPGLCVLEYILKYIQDSINIEKKEDDYSYEYGEYFYVPFLLSNHVMLNEQFHPDFPILYDGKLKEQEFLNFFVESIQPEYRIIKHSEELGIFDYTISNLKQELRFKQNKKNNNKYNYFSKDLIAKYDPLCKLNESEGLKIKQNEKVENSLYSFQGDLELALWYRKLEGSLQSKEELDKKSENNAYKLYLHIRQNIEEWYELLCVKKSNYDFFNKIVTEYSKAIEEKIHKLKLACLDKFKEFNNEKKTSCKEKAFFEEFYKIVKDKLELKDNVTFDKILEHFEDKYKKQEDSSLSKDEYKDIRAFFEAFYNIVIRQQNFSRFFVFLKNFNDSVWNKLSFVNSNLDDSLFKFTDKQKYNDSFRDADSDDEISLNKVVLGNDCESISSAQKLAECWDNIFLSNKNNVDIKTNFKDFLENLGFGINTIKKDSKIQFVYDDEKLEFSNNFIVKLLPKIFKHPIVGFGSDAVDKGFRVVSIDRDKINNSDIVDFLINFIKNIKIEPNNDPHTIILFDYALTLEDRRTLANSIKTEVNSNGTRNTLFLVIDRVLITFLMKYYKTETINEMLLYIASPFGFFQPYIPSEGIGVTDAITLNEMFIGRNDELKKIKDLKIPLNIVYGGRQLGKSSLLTKATKDINENKDNGRAVYVNLEDINRSTSDINLEDVYNLVLNKIVKKMKNDQIFKDNVKINCWDDFKDEVENVIKSDEISYLVLLIDEVDIFFKACDNNKDNPMKIFSDIVRIAKDNTKQFKIVFAGLNMIKDYEFLTGDNGLLGQIDKDRTHDGDYYVPILPFNDEDARKLIENPLRYLGLYFSQDPNADFESDPESLMYLIFDKTNYYPCLIQLYCKKLLMAMCKDNYAHYDDKSPVYYVNTEHIKDIISDLGFRDTVKHKFDITLALSPTDSKADRTYKYLATILAYLCYNGVEGYSSYKIEDFVKVAKDCDIKHICDLYEKNKLELYMDHLVELSVFSREYVEEDKTVKKYGFRRLPLWQLMGEKDDIEYDLLSFASDN